MNPPRWTWAGLLAIWATGVLFWTLAAARGLGEPALHALPFGIVQMGVAAIMAAGVWYLTGLVPWQSHRALFVTVHLAAVVAFAFGYAAAQGLAFLGERSIADCLRFALNSPYTGWNLLMGTWLYLAIAGVSYGRRAEASRRAGERARAAAEILARDAQLSALNAQLQPHFLFNALHTVSSLVHIDPDRADRALDELGRLLRYALRQSNEDVTLRDEWEFTREYLAFEALRLGDRLRLETKINDAALDAAVPPFILQPLVENAVRHGVANSPSGGDIAVSIARDDGFVTLWVANSLAAGAVTNGMAGTGLQRLRDRLALKYAPGLTEVEVASGTKFAVAVKLPWQPKDDC
jgi:two-component sensor histidine kinase